MPPAPTADRLARELQEGLSLLLRRFRQTRLVADLSQPESQALGSLLRFAPVTSAELARQEAISPQSMGTTLAGLERRGLVRRRPDPEDGRRVLLEPTPAGRAKAQTKRSARADQLAAAIRAELTPEERATLLAAAPLLARLSRALGSGS